MLAVHHHPPCRAVHGPVYCVVVEHRHATRKLLAPLRFQEHRTRRRAMHVHITWRPWPSVRQVHAMRRRITWLRRVPTWRPPHPTSVIGAICYFWHPCDGALRVARCESGLSTGAANGQYEGLFQMGSSERSRYGSGSSAWDQARAAHAYYSAAGGWGPWTCGFAA